MSSRIIYDLALLTSQPQLLLLPHHSLHSSQAGRLQTQRIRLLAVPSDRVSLSPDFSKTGLVYVTTSEKPIHLRQTFLLHTVTVYPGDSDYLHRMAHRAISYQNSAAHHKICFVPI